MIILDAEHEDWLHPWAGKVKFRILKDGSRHRNC
jgi:hypothetical protein